MSASKTAKRAGLSSLREMSQISNVSERCLYNWYNDNQQLFIIILSGCVDYKELQKQFCDAAEKCKASKALYDISEICKGRANEEIKELKC